MGNEFLIWKYRCRHQKFIPNRYPHPFNRGMYVICKIKTSSDCVWVVECLQPHTLAVHDFQFWSDQIGKQRVLLLRSLRINQKAGWRKLLAELYSDFRLDAVLKRAPRRRDVLAEGQPPTRPAQASIEFFQLRELHRASLSSLRSTISGQSRKKAHFRLLRQRTEQKLPPGRQHGASYPP